MLEEQDQGTIRPTESKNIHKIETSSIIDGTVLMTVLYDKLMEVRFRHPMHMYYFTKEADFLMR